MIRCPHEAAAPFGRADGFAQGRPLEALLRSAETSAPVDLAGVAA